MAGTSTRQIVSGQVYSVNYSADGRYLSYTVDEGDVGNLYVVDLSDGFIRKIASGEADSIATQPIASALSADGSFILFDNHAANPSALFVKNQHTGMTSQITLDSAKYDDVVALGISADGRFVVYNGHVTGTGGLFGGTPSQDVTVVRDLTTQSEVVVGPASPSHFDTDLTPDGHYLALTVNNRLIVFDVQTGTTLLDRPLPVGSSLLGSIRVSDDGRYVAYDIFTTDRTVAQVYLHDMQNPSAPDRIVSTAADGTAANDSSALQDFSGDGRHVLFTSISTNLGGSSSAHYYLKDLDTGAIQPLASGGLLSHDASTIITTGDLSGLYLTTVLPPTITISTISGDDRINALEEEIFPVTVSGTSDTDGATIRVTSPSGATSTTTVTGQHWSTTVMTSGTTDGQHDFTVTATDDFGHTGTATRPVLFDSVPPFISYSLNGTGSINATQLAASVISGASDAVGRVVTFKIDNTVIGQATIQTPTPDSGNLGAYSLSFDASGFHDGVHILSVSIADAAGNVTSETLAFDVDTVPPRISITSVAEDDVVNGTEIGATSVSGTSEAIGKTVTITVGDQILGTAEVQQDGTWIAGVSFEGSAGLTDVVASVSDMAGNVGTASQPVIVDGNVIRVSTDSQGHEGTGAFDDFHGFLLGDISANARFVLFYANGGPTNFTPDAVDHNSHAFLKDLKTGSLTPLGQFEDPDLGAYFGSGAQELADDGRHLLFDLHGSYNVIDLSTGVVTRVDTNAQGQPDNGPEFSDNGYVTGAPHISGDGRYVTFWSVGTNLVPGVSDGNPHLYVKDLQTPQDQPSGDVRLVSFPGAEPQSPFTLTSSSNIAAGRYVAFTSNLPAAPSDTNGVQDIFLRDLQTGAVTLISANLSGQAGNSYSYDPVISADGHFVAFTSHASDLVAGQSSGPGQVYLRDVQTGTTQLVSTIAGNPIPGHADSISSDGRYVGWTSPGTFDVNVWVYDTQTGSSTLVSKARAGVDDYVADTAYLTPDGRYMAFVSVATNNVPGDTNQTTDVFLRRLDISGTMTLDPIAGNDAISSSERSSALAVSGSTNLQDGTISVRIDGVEYGTATVGANGHWATTIDVKALAEGRHAFAATVLDDLGFATSDGAIVDVAGIPQGGSPVNLALATDSGAPGDGITNIGTVNVSALQTGATYQYSVNGGAFITGTGTSFTLTGDGPKTVLVHQTVAGNTSANTSLSFTLDTVAAAPTIALAVDSGTPGDGITNVGTVNVSGLETGATWQYSVNGAAFVTGAGTSFTLTGDGPKTVLVHETDAAGNISTDASLNFTLASGVATPAVALATDSGIAGDGITNVGTVNVSGLQTDATYQYAVNGGAFVAGTGTSFTLTGDGPKTVLVHETDTAGNVSTNASLSFTLDTVAAAPTVALATDSGVAGDGITNVGTVNVSGLESGATYQYAVNGGAFVTGTGTSFTLTGDGPKAVLVHQTDAAGNTSTNASLNFTLDTSAAAPAVALATDSGIAGDGITNVGTVNVSGLEPGATWQYAINGGSFVTGTGTSVTLTGDGPKTVLVHQTDAAGNTSTNASLNFTLDSSAAAPAVALATDSGIAGDGITNVGTVNVSALEAGATWQYAVNGGSFVTGTGTSFTLTGDGPKAVVVHQTDAAGNTSSNASLNFTLDTGAAAPAVALATDSGIAGDGITRIGTVNVSGLEAGATWQYAVNGGAFVAGTGTSVTLSGDGPKAVLVHQTDAAGNVSGNASLNFTLDSSAAAPAVALATDSGIAGDGITRIGTVNVSGLEAGATWQYAVNGGAFIAGTGTSVTLTGDGPKAVLVHQTDAAGNVSGNTTLNFTLDTSAAAPAVALATDSGIAGDGITRIGTVNISGLETGATWQYSVNGGGFVTGTGTSFTLTGDGPKTVLVHQTDAAGNVSGNASLNFTLDTDAAAPAVALATDSGIAGDGITRIGTVNISGLEAGATWQYAVNGGGFVTGTGTSFTLTGDGPKTVLVHQTDAAGNVSGNAALNFTLDTTVPLNDVITTAGGTVTNPVQVISGTGEAGSTIQLHDGAANIGATATVDGTGHWSQSVTLTGAGAHVITAIDTDIAGNSTTSNAITLTLNNGDIVGQPGQGVVNGTNGPDHVVIGSTNLVASAGGGDDTIKISATNGLSFHFIDGGSGTDTLDLSALAGPANVNLDAGFAILTAPPGVQLLTSIENVIGSSGADRITASASVNILTGGGGADTFIFSNMDAVRNGATFNAAKRDVITDFVHGTDRIDLSGIDTNTGAGGTQHFSGISLWNGTGAEFTAPNQLRFHYETIAGQEHTIIDGNINANLGVDFQIDLAKHIALTASDFVLV